MSNAQNTTMTFSNATLVDVLDAHEFAQGRMMGSNWINAVDPETMDAVKRVYRSASDVDGSLSLHKVFCVALKQARKM